MPSNYIASESECESNFLIQPNVNECESITLNNKISNTYKVFDDWIDVTEENVSNSCKKDSSDEEFSEENIGITLIAIFILIEIVLYIKINVKYKNFTFFCILYCQKYRN